MESAPPFLVLPASGLHRLLLAVKGEQAGASRSLVRRFLAASSGIGRREADALVAGLVRNGVIVGHRRVRLSEQGELALVQANARARRSDERYLFCNS